MHSPFGGCCPERDPYTCRALLLGCPHYGLLRSLRPLPCLSELGDLLQLSLRLGLYSIWEEVCEVLQKIRVVCEQKGHFVQNFLYAALLLLVRVQNLQELLVCLRLRSKALLDCRDIINGMIKLNGLLGTTSSTSSATSYSPKRLLRLALGRGGRTTCHGGSCTERQRPRHRRARRRTLPMRSEGVQRGTGGGVACGHARGTHRTWRNGGSGLWSRGSARRCRRRVWSA